MFLIKGWLPCVTIFCSCVSHPICGNYSVFSLVYPICFYMFYSWVSICCCFLMSFHELVYPITLSLSISHTHALSIFHRLPWRIPDVLRELADLQSCSLFAKYLSFFSASFCKILHRRSPFEPSLLLLCSKVLTFVFSVSPQLCSSLQVVVFGVNGVYTFVVVASCASPVSSNMRACEFVLVLRCCSVNFTFTPSAQLSQLFDRF